MKRLVLCCIAAGAFFSLGFLTSNVVDQLSAELLQEQQRAEVYYYWLGYNDYARGYFEGRANALYQARWLLQKGDTFGSIWGNDQFIASNPPFGGQ